MLLLSKLHVFTMPLNSSSCFEVNYSDRLTMPAVRVAVLTADWKILCFACLPTSVTIAMLLRLGLTSILQAAEAGITPDLLRGMPLLLLSLLCI